MTNKKQQVEQVVWNITQTAQRLGIDRRTLKEYMKSGLIAYSLIGKKYFFTDEDIQLFLAKTRRDVDKA